MNMLLFMSIIVYFLSFIIMMLAMIFSKKTNNEREKSSPFECGFDPMKSSRIPFSIRFFLITIIFLIFDVEITLILPMILMMKISNIYSWLISSMMYIFILLIGLYHEWNQGALNWNY